LKIGQYILRRYEAYKNVPILGHPVFATSTRIQLKHTETLLLQAAVKSWHFAQHTDFLGLLTVRDQWLPAKFWYHNCILFLFQQVQRRSLSVIRL